MYGPDKLKDLINNKYFKIINDAIDKANKDSGVTAAEVTPLAAVPPAPVGAPPPPPLPPSPPAKTEKLANPAKPAKTEKSEKPKIGLELPNFLETARLKAELQKRFARANGSSEESEESDEWD